MVQRKYTLTFFLLLILGMMHAFAKNSSNAHLQVSETEAIFVPCATLIAPNQGATNVPVETNISWQPVPDAVGYTVSLGSSSGGTDILTGFAVNGTNFNPPLGLPESTTVYITIVARLADLTEITCDEQNFTTENVTIPPVCTNLNQPADGSTEVDLNPTLVWSYAAKATGYFISIGTTPGGTDVWNNEDVGNVLSIPAPGPLDPQVTYYVTVTPYNENGTAVACTETNFTTGGALEPPGCTQLFSPADGATDVPLTPLLEWLPVADADGYILNVGTFPGGTDILDNANLGNQTDTFVVEFDPGLTFYVTIIPYNTAGQAVGCTETSFSTTRGCGPYIDDITGEVVDFRPVILLDDSYQLCLNEGDLVIDYGGEGDAFIWSTLDSVGEPFLTISQDRQVTIREAGSYVLEVFSTELVGGFELNCSNSHSFTVTVSEAPEITGIDINNVGLGSELIITAEGQGDYEYSIDNGQNFQDSPIFSGIPQGNISIIVQDKNGCGEVVREIKRDSGFPKYFTPNGDGINDYWQVRGRRVQGEIVTLIDIYDRYGKMIKRIDSRSKGWDGTYQGELLFDSGYWYKAQTESGAIFTGFFALKL